MGRTGVRRREEDRETGRRNVRRSGSASCLHARAGVSLKHTQRKRERKRDRRSRNIERIDEDNKKEK